jgi:alpha-tubulin suppressor-like RCC1 family protein
MIEPRSRRTSVLVSAVCLLILPSCSDATGPDDAPDPGLAVAVVAGARYTLALAADGTAYCWGLNDGGSCGAGTWESPLFRPTKVTGGLTFEGLSAGVRHSCGLTGEGQAYCWGYNGYGTVGDGTGENRSAPLAVAPQERFEVLESSGSHVCALNRQGAAFCWGRNHRGQLGSGSGDLGWNVPVLVRW